MNKDRRDDKPWLDNVEVLRRAIWFDRLRFYGSSRNCKPAVGEREFIEKKSARSPKAHFPWNTFRILASLIGETGWVVPAFNRFTSSQIWMPYSDIKHFQIPNLSQERSLTTWFW